jgi:hypothetical protein
LARSLTLIFRVVAMVVAFCGVLLFFFVPETFWDRAPVPRSRKPKSRPNFFRRLSSKQDVLHATPLPTPLARDFPEDAPVTPGHAKAHRVGFAADTEKNVDTSSESSASKSEGEQTHDQKVGAGDQTSSPAQVHFPETVPRSPSPATAPVPRTPADPYHNDTDAESLSSRSTRTGGPLPYTAALRDQPALPFVQSLRPFHGRLCKDKWWKVAIRPLILFSYPAVLWSAVVYACSVGWLIVISESMAVIYREEIYSFNALQTGLVYISPFVGGILGSAVAGTISDVIVQAMARRNGGLYEPEFRLVMAIPIAITTVIGLMGFGWSAEVRDHWMVPTAFFGIISFGCTMGSTTSITFCVDSYRQYAGEALVTLNFSKNVLHGLVFSLFVTGWLSDDGPKKVYIWIGIIQLILLLFTIPMYIYGKRLRMWTVRMNFMERF